MNRGRARKQNLEAVPSQGREETVSANKGLHADEDDELGDMEHRGYQGKFGRSTTEGE